MRSWLKIQIFLSWVQQSFVLSLHVIHYVLCKLIILHIPSGNFHVNDTQKFMSQILIKYVMYNRDLLTQIQTTVMTLLEVIFLSK